MLIGNVELAAIIEATSCKIMKGTNSFIVAQDFPRENQLDIVAEVDHNDITLAHNELHINCGTFTIQADENITVLESIPMAGTMETSEPYAVENTENVICLFFQNTGMPRLLDQGL